jgi:hypothetical protein
MTFITTKVQAADDGVNYATEYSEPLFVIGAHRPVAA